MIWEPQPWTRSDSQDQPMKMNKLSVQLGYWSALVCVIALVVFPVCYVTIQMLNPPFTWTNLADFDAYTKANNQFFKHLAEFLMLVLGSAFVVLLNSIHDYATEANKVLTRAGLAFAIVFATLTGANYFVQLSAVPLQLAQGRANGLEQFIQSNPVSGIAAMNMLGWTVFLGLASLFIAPVFSGGRVERIIRYAFLANGIICILGGIGYVLDIVIVVFLCMVLGMGAALLLATISLCVLFRRMRKLAESYPPGTGI